MLSGKARHVLVAACVLTAMSAVLSTTVVDADEPLSCVIAAKRPARTFYPGEPIQLTVRVDGPRDVAVYTVTDHRGRKRAGGRVRAGSGQPALLEIERELPTGIYFLRLEFRSGPVVEDAFCILPRADRNVGDGRLFGVGWRPRNDAQWAALAQMGARHVRAEITWPDTEHTRGEYDFGVADMYARGARKFGLQLSILSGYTPRLYGMVPVDGDGRPAAAWWTWAPADTIEWSRFTDALASRMLRQSVPPFQVDDAKADDQPRFALATAGNGQRARGKGERLTATAKAPAGNRRSVIGGAVAPLPFAPSPLPAAKLRQARPMVIAWEVWSEADQNFYYGTWERYLDMLRIAYCTVKQHAPRVPVVYGSCGHWTEMAFTLQAGCADHFDLLAYHPGGSDPGWSLEDWMVNMPQALLKSGRPRESAYTETYFAPDDPALEPSFQLRLYATLKAWRQRTHIRSGCLGRLIGRYGADEHALLWERDGQLIPRPGYVGFAVARWLLEDARYVGPLNLAANARLELFIKHGQPLVIAWADSEQRVPLRLLRSAQLINAMGEVRELRQASFQLPVGPKAVALWGVDYDYARMAAWLATERVLTTELGFYSDHNSSYVDPLEQDAARWISPGFVDEVRRAVRQACQESRERPCRGPSAFYVVQRVVGAGMIQAVRTCQREGDLTPGARNVIWRLAQYVEALGIISDGLGDRWPEMNNVTEQDLTKVLSQAHGARERVRAKRSGAECPFADRLIDRALEQLRWTEESGGECRGAWWAALTQVRAASALAQIEKPVLRKAFVAVNFPSGQQFTKATLLPPGPKHSLTARVYNYLDRPVSGALKLQMPEAWEGAEPRVPFSVPARGVSEPLEVAFGVPDEPTPWVTKSAWRAWDQELLVDLPQPLSPNAELWVSGESEVGPDLPAMHYRLCVGSYPARAQSAVAERVPADADRPSDSDAGA